MAKIVHLNEGGKPYCGSKTKSPKLSGSIEKGISDIVNCKKCRKKAEDNGINVIVPFFKRVGLGGDSKIKKPSQSEKMDMSVYDNKSGWFSINDKLPPETLDKISTVECLYGIESHDEISIVTLQHIYHDISLLGFSRVTHWKYRE